MPPKILHVLGTANYAGTEAHVLTLLQSLDPEQFSAALLCRQGSPLHERAEAAGIRCFNDATLAARRRLLRRERFALVHAHDGNSKLSSVLAARLSGTGARVVATQHFVQPAYAQRGGGKGKLAALIHKGVNRLLARMIAVSEAVRRAALERGEIASGKIEVVPNGLSLPDLSLVPLVQATRAEFGIAADVPVICTVARLSPEKGLAHLLRAIPVVRAQFPSVHFLIVGDGPLRAELEAQADGLGIRGCLHFAGFRSDVPDLLAGSDVFVLPSPAEPFGLVLLEAMAASRPVVAVAAGGPLEIVVPEVTGLLVPPADPDALAQAVVRLLADPVQARAMGEAGRQRVETHFSAAQMARRTEAVYRQCLRLPRRSEQGASE